MQYTLYLRHEHTTPRNYNAQSQELHERATNTSDNSDLCHIHIDNNRTNTMNTTTQPKFDHNGMNYKAPTAKAMIADGYSPEDAREIRAIYANSDKVSGGEYLGGNGLTDWHHCSCNDKADKFDMDTDAEGVTFEEKAILALYASEHQTHIEANGVYIVRQLARWKHGFDPEAALNAKQARHDKALGIRVTDSNNTKRKDTSAARKAKRMAKLARKG